MPTKAGRPRKGETLYDAKGNPIGVIEEVERGKVYSVKVKKPGHRFLTSIHEFEYWVKRHNWTFR
jgi:hypothetical protein